jgi:acetate kinase
MGTQVPVVEGAPSWAPLSLELMNPSIVKRIIALNCGSSSVKWAGFDLQGPPESAVCQISGRGLIEGTGETAIHAALDAAAQGIDADSVMGVGHRVVHGGMHYTESVVLTPEIVTALDALSPLAPLHQPIDILGIEVAQQRFANAQHVAVFDTAFHRGHDFVNDTYALPRRFYDEGVRRYGFHGISYAYIAEKIALQFPELTDARVIVAHLGSGASMCAMQSGKSVACTMGFSALDGLAMGSRCGQIDPGVLLYFMQQKQMTADEISDLLYKSSGLKGISGISGDMRELLASPAPQARQAVDYFVARCCHEMGGLAAALGGIDAIVFTGGMGERAPAIRLAIAERMQWLGVSIDPLKNAALPMTPDLSATDAAVRVLCLPTDEESMIGLETQRHLLPRA